MRAGAPSSVALFWVAVLAVTSPLLPEDEDDFADRVQRDPAWFVEEVLGMRPWPKQIEILESVRDNKETAVRSSHGIGKSCVAGMATHWFLSGGPGIVITTCVTQRQVRKVVWKEIRSQYFRAKRRGWGLGPDPLIEELRIDDNWYAIGFTASSADAFQGHHSESGRILVIVDEASGIDDEIFDEGVSAVLVGDKSRLLMLGNPTNPDGEFAKAFKPDSGVEKIAVSAFDTPNFTDFGITKQDIERGSWESKLAGQKLPYPSLVDPDWVSRRFKRWGRSWDDPRVLARILGVFPEKSSNRLIPLHMFEKAQARELEPTDPTVLGVDVARYGDDASEICLRRGPHARIVFTGHGLSTVELTGHVRRVADEIGPDAIHVDVVGVGAGVVDQLEAEGYPVKGINVGVPATDTEHFVNLRAELSWAVRERFEDGDIDVDEADEELASQCTDIVYSFDARGRIAIERKEDAKKRGIPSPDKFDALMLAFAPIDHGPGIYL